MSDQTAENAGAEKPAESDVMGTPPLTACFQIGNSQPVCVTDNCECKRQLARWRPPSCQSCGERSYVTLPDGSTWCVECDESAKRLGYNALEVVE